MRGQLLSDRNGRRLRFSEESIHNEAQTEARLAGVRRSVKRGSPYGKPRWQQQTARAMGLEASLRPLGRPKKRKQVATRELEG
jgi:hypothetical protein